MQPKVQEYLDFVEQQLSASQIASKEDILRSAGLVEREYASDASGAEHLRYDGEKKEYYNEKVMEVSDEEYEAIRSAYNRLQCVNEKKNTVTSNGIALILKLIAVLTYVGGLFLGFALGKDHWGFSFSAALVYWVAAWVTGSMVMGFAEIIKLLQAIKEK